MSDKLVELIAHLYSAEEAAICKGLTFLYPRSTDTISKICQREAREVLPLLKAMAQRRVIHETDGKFMLYPLIPGIFEYVFMTGRDSPWHTKYAQLINELFGTGYIREYLTRDIGAVRNIPVETSIDNTNYVVGAGLMSRMLEAHDRFAVLNYCACRHSKRLIGHSCRRATPEDGCLVFGEFSAATVANGNGRPVSRAEMAVVVARRWEKNLVFLTANVDPASQNVICTCCDCCCHALETANYYSRNFIAAAHHVAQVDDSLCSNCGQCVAACNTHAHAVDDGTHRLLTDKCIGCGYCVAACKRTAIRLVENPCFTRPKSGYVRLLMNMIAPITMMGLKIKWKRSFGKKQSSGERRGDGVSARGERPPADR